MTTTNTATSDLEYADKLWKDADALRGQVDAAEYKHVVLGLLFLKYISDSFEARRDELREELIKDGIKGKQLDGLLEGRNEYVAERVFWVSPEARWSNLQPTSARNPRTRSCATFTRTSTPTTSLPTSPSTSAIGRTSSSAMTHAESSARRPWATPITRGSSTSFIT